jgi:uncharacterized protein (TIGR03435 family)
LRTRIGCALAALAAVVSPVVASGGPQLPEGDASRFVVASVRRNVSGNGGSRISHAGETLTIANAPLRNIIEWAYGVGRFRAHPLATIENAPQWISDRYDIVAKSAEPLPTPPVNIVGRLNLMVQTLLADRFGLITHWETREASAEALVLAAPGGKLGPGIRSSSVDCAAFRAAEKIARAAGRLPAEELSGGPRRTPPCGVREQPSRQFSGVEVLMGVQPMKALADLLARRLRRPVTDRTGLSGNFDIELTYSADGLAVDAVRGPSLGEALRDQLGLKLMPERGSVEILVIDRLERPSAN